MRTFVNQQAHITREVPELAMSDKKHIAIVRVSAELFLSALAFPEGTRIKGYRCEGGHRVTIELVMVHPDLPEVPYGENPPVIAPIIKQVGMRPDEWLSFDWNLPE